MNLEQQAKNVAAQGRYGDSMLLHVNPAEVKGLAQAMPNMITVNPRTGQPEAFLPMLAPLLGSLAGSALAGTTLIPALAGKTLLASSIGSALAQTAATGDIKKGLLAGLTGYGFGKVLQGAGAEAGRLAAEGAQKQALEGQMTDILTQDALKNPEFLADAVQPTAQGAADFWTKSSVPTSPLNTQGQEWLTSNLNARMSHPDVARSISYAGEHGFGTAGTPNFIQGSKDYLAGNPALGDAFSDAGGFSKEGFKNILASASDPMNMLPIAGGMAPTAIMESQEEFERQIARNEREREEERQRIMADNPEMIPTPWAGGGQFKLNTNGYNVGGDIRNMIDPLLDRVDAASNLEDYTGQGYVKERTPVSIDPYFQAGFQPEMSYFKTLNPSATGLDDGVAQDTSGGFLGRPTSRMFNPTQTAGYQSFYGDSARDIIPNVVDPYAPLNFNQAPRMPSIPEPIDGYRPIEPTPPTGPVAPIPPDIPIGPIGPIGPGMPTPKGSAAVPESLLDMNEINNGNFVQDNFLERMGDINLPNITLPNMLPPQTDIENINIPIQPADTLEPNLSLLEPQFVPPTIQDIPYIPNSPISPNIPLSFAPKLSPNQINPVGMPSVGGLMAEGGKTEYQEGGETGIDIDMNDPLVQGVINFLLGNAADESIINQFIEQYGFDAFVQLRRQVLNEVVPGAQTEGQIAGNNQGGMADDIGGMIGNKERVAVSQDEYIVPADVVSMLGDGSSDSGAAKLDNMLDRVREVKTGRTTQAAPLKENVLPA